MEENQTTEFKESWRDEYLKHICAFANSKGGDLYIGIKDDGMLVGISNSKKLMEDIPNKTIQLLGIHVDIYVEKMDGYDVLRIPVQQSTVPISYHGRFYIRSGSTVQELQGEKLRNFILKKDSITWDEIGIPQARIEDIDEPVVRKFVSKAVKKNRLYAEAIDDSLTSLLNKLNLIDKQGQLTRAAILLFGKHPGKYFKTAIIKIGRFGESYSDLISQDIVEGNIYDMPDKVMELLRIKYLHSLISYKGLERIEDLEYPEKALREAILNAIVHRDYGDLSDITIRVFDNRIEFWNSGSLMEPLKIELLKEDHPSKRRNVYIANIFFRAGLIEAWGRGTILIMKELRSAGLPEPKIEEYAGGIKLSFFKATPTATPTATPKMTTEDEVLRCIMANDNISKREIAEMLGITRDGVSYHIKRLSKKGRIKWVGPAKTGHWEINTN